MKRLPLLLLSMGLVSCAPLPPLVTDPPEESQPESSVSRASQDSESASSAAASSSSKSEVSSSAATDTTAFTPIAPAVLNEPDDSTGNAPAPAKDEFPTKLLPENLRRDFRVGILLGKPRVEISGEAYTVSATADSAQGHSASGKLNLSANGMRVSLQNTKADSVWVFPSNGKRLSVGGKEYRGKMLIVNASGKLNVLNVLPVEDYLKGVVPNEIGKLDSSMFEALKAQAVAARTYAYRHYNSRASLGFDVYATVQDQVYDGSAGESPLPSAAIDSTRGVVLTDGESFIEAYYHSTCGGNTDGVEVWGLSPVAYLKSQSDMKDSNEAWCNASSYSSWKKVFSEKELVALFRKNFKEARATGKSEFGKIQQMEILSTFPGGRVGELEVLTDKGVFTVKGDRIRWLFKDGSKILPSAKFSLSKNGKVWVLDGSGFGHGIGMCQMGVRARAKAGQNYVEILNAYYSEAKLQCVQEP